MQSKLSNLSSNDVQLRGDEVYITPKHLRGTPGILLVWAKWCGACHAFIPTFKQLCNQIGDEFKCAAIEQSQLENSSAVLKALDVQYFPTIKFFDQNGKIVGTYPGDAPRGIGDLLDYICKFYHHCIVYH